MKVDYEYYTEIYGGTKLAEKDWQRISQKAEQRLDSDGEEKDWCDRAKCAVCEMSEILYADEKRNGKTSENTDGYSVSYDTGVSLNSLLYSIVQVYLGNTGLLYAGVDAEC